MSLQIFSTGFLFILSSCGGPPDSVAPAEPENAIASETGTPAGDPVERVACAIGDGAMATECTVERVAEADRTIIVVRHPDGGFRRLQITRAGAVEAADGAAPAAVTVRDGVAEVALGDARYRLPLDRW